MNRHDIPQNKLLEVHIFGTNESFIGVAQNVDRDGFELMLSGGQGVKFIRYKEIIAVEVIKWTTIRKLCLS